MGEGGREVWSWESQYCKKSAGIYDCQFMAAVVYIDIAVVSWSMKTERIAREVVFNRTARERRLPQHRIGFIIALEFQFLRLHQMFDLVHVKLDVRVHLQILVVSRVDLVLDVFLQVGHLTLSD